jgi:hypothetical protein
LTRTRFERTMAPATRVVQRVRPEQHASSDQWETMAVFEVAPPTTQPWHAAVYATADVDPGVTAQLRFRSSAAVATTPGAWSVTGGQIIDTSGAEFITAGLNGGAPVALGQFGSSGGEYVAWSHEGYPTYTLSPDIWPGDTNLVGALEVFPGGHINGGRWWSNETNPPSGNWADVPDRVYALTGVRSASAIAKGIQAPSDHWHSRLYRMVTHLRSGPYTWEAGKTADQTVPQYIARIQELVAMLLVVAVEDHDMTGTNPVLPAGLVTDPMLAVASVADGPIRDLLKLIDAFAAAFPGASSNAWFCLPNEPFNTGRSTDYDNFVVTLCRRLRGKGFGGIISIPLARYSQDLRVLGEGGYNSLISTLTSFGVGNFVWEWHNYGQRWTSAGVSTIGTYAEWDADLTACRSNGRAVWMAEYGQATPVGTGVTGNDAAERAAVLIMATSTYGQPLGQKHKHICPTWWALADHTFDRSYSLTYGAANKGNENGPDPNVTGASHGTYPPWDVTSAALRDEWLTPGGRAHWDLAHQIFQDPTGSSSGITPGVPVVGYAQNIRLGFEGLPPGRQLLYVEGRRVGGSGGVRLMQAKVALTSAPKSSWITSAPPVPPVTTTAGYLWENRPAYVEPNPGGGPGTAGKVLADSLGLLRRVVVNSTTSFAAATVAALPGDQIYVSASLVGNGTNRVVNWQATNAPAGGGGTAPSGTATNPIMITCAPGVWIDGGQVAGAVDLNSRGIYLVGANHVWLYGVNVRRANFLVMYNQCAGTLANPIRVWYSTFADSGHSMMAIAGNFGSGGQSAFFSLKYNSFDNSGLGDQQFGEAIYLGYGSTNSPTLQQNHDIIIEANHFTRLTAESCDMKAGTQKVFFKYNLIEDCIDHATPARTGDAANVGFPGAFQFPGHTTPAAGWSALSDVIGNRWKNCTSASTKYPDGLVLVGARGFNVAGNLFSDCNVGSAGLIVFYLDGNVPMAPGDTGTVQVHNNTARDCNSMNALYRVTNAGASQPALLAIMMANSGSSNNVRANSPAAATGANYSVTDAAFTTDGTGYPGGFSAVTPGGALDVTGANTTANWALDYAGHVVAAPVKPGAYQ